MMIVKMIKKIPNPINLDHYLTAFLVVIVGLVSITSWSISVTRKFVFPMKILDLLERKVLKKLLIKRQINHHLKQDVGQQPID